MEKRFEMRFTGSGGQGVILASVIFAEAAVIADKNAIQSQAYGPEARGGMSKAETIISDEKLWFSKVICPDFLLALTKQSLMKYGTDLKEGGLIIVDSSIPIPEAIKQKTKVISVPILDAAKTEVGKAMTANIVAVGAINNALNLFPEEILDLAVKRHIPKGTEALNEKALEVGKKLINRE